MTAARIRSLDGLRGIAILLVIAGHIAANYQPLAPEARRWAEAFANSGFGVRLFFVLSGFLITTLMLREQTSTGGVSLARFYERRVFRIIPAAWTYLAFLALVPWLRPASLNAANWSAAGGFVWNYAHLFIDPSRRQCWELGHFWTLAVEQQFYLVWPAVFLWLGRRRALGFAILVVVWSPLARVGTYFLFPSLRGTTNMMFHTGADSLMVGCAAALAATSPRLQLALARGGSPAAGLAALWALGLSPLISETFHGFPDVLGITLDAFAAAWLILAAQQAGAGRWVRGLERGPLPWIGVISYSLYLWQQIFLSPTSALSAGHILLPTLGALTAATISYWLVERPVLRWAARFRRVALAVPAAAKS